MHKTLFIFLPAALLLLIHACTSHGPAPEVELRYEKNLSLEYDEVIHAYQAMADYYPGAELLEMGATDVGKPLHLFMISGDEDFDPASIRDKGRSIVLINNGIHAGEPAGVDASVKYALNLLEAEEDINHVLDNTAIAIIPVFNIGGYLNLSRYHRMNQDGPKYKGSRRNARNLDLNRDFSKQDSQNARSFAKIFHYLDPDVFIDTHTTNGVEHKEVMTLIPTLHNRLHHELAAFFREMTDTLYHRMNSETEWGAIPYVHRPGFRNVRKGIAAFNDHPHYSSGYAALFNTPGFITETQYAKPYPERVKATYDFIVFTAEYAAQHASQIIKLREKAAESTTRQRTFTLDWDLNMENHDSLLFRGYETEVSLSPLTGRQVTGYNHNEPWEAYIPFYDNYLASLKVEAPGAYIIPQAWPDIIQRLKLNGVEVSYLKHDTLLDVKTTYIRGYNVRPATSQGRQTAEITSKELISGPRQFYAGDAIIKTNQRANHYIVHMLEPEAPASFFQWGLFNSALEDGEGWWIYAFEDYAYEYLQEDDSLRKAFEKKLTRDDHFADDAISQLNFILNHITRDKTERGWHLYPVARYPE